MCVRVCVGEVRLYFMVIYVQMDKSLLDQVPVGVNFN